MSRRVDPYTDDGGCRRRGNGFRASQSGSGYSRLVRLGCGANIDVGVSMRLGIRGRLAALIVVALVASAVLLIGTGRDGTRGRLQQVITGSPSAAGGVPVASADRPDCLRDPAAQQAVLQRAMDNSRNKDLLESEFFGTCIEVRGSLVEMARVDDKGAPAKKGGWCRIGMAAPFTVKSALGGDAAKLTTLQCKWQCLFPVEQAKALAAASGGTLHVRGVLSGWSSSAEEHTACFTLNSCELID